MTGSQIGVRNPVPDFAPAVDRQMIDRGREALFPFDLERAQNSGEGVAEVDFLQLKRDSEEISLEVTLILADLFHPIRCFPLAFDEPLPIDFPEQLFGFRERLFRAQKGGSDVQHEEGATFAIHLHEGLA